MLEKLPRADLDGLVWFPNGIFSFLDGLGSGEMFKRSLRLVEACLVGKDTLSSPVMKRTFRGYFGEFCTLK